MSNGESDRDRDAGRAARTAVSAPGSAQQAAARTSVTRSGSTGDAPEPSGVAGGAQTPGVASPPAPAAGGDEPSGALDVPQRLGPYRIVRALGEGGMGKVYLAHDDKLDREVAIKVLSKQLADDPGFRDRFLQEARAIAKVNHPNVVQVYYADHDQGVCFFAMECVKGRTLEDRIRSTGAIDVHEALAIVTQAAQGLEAAFARGILHRDIKPSNIIIDEAGKVKLLDFGLAKDMQSSTSRTSTGMFLGTPRYMSPEQGRGMKPDFRSDMYSLGVTLYEALAGVPPFDGETPLSVIDKHVRLPVPDIQTIRKGIPIAVVALLERMLAKEPDQRHASHAALLADLGAAASTTGGANARTALVRGPATPAPSLAASPAMSRESQAVHGDAPHSVASIQAAAPPGAPTPVAIAATDDDRFPLDDLVSSLATPRAYFDGAGRSKGALRGLAFALFLSLVTAADVIASGAPPQKEPLRLLVTGLALMIITHVAARLLRGEGSWRHTVTLEAAGLTALALAVTAFDAATLKFQQAAQSPGPPMPGPLFPTSIALGVLALILHMRTRWAGIAVLHRLQGTRLALTFLLGSLLAFVYVGQTVASVKAASHAHPAATMSAEPPRPTASPSVTPRVIPAASPSIQPSPAASAASAAPTPAPPPPSPPSATPSPTPPSPSPTPSQPPPPRPSPPRPSPPPRAIKPSAPPEPADDSDTSDTADSSGSAPSGAGDTAQPQPPPAQQQPSQTRNPFPPGFKNWPMQAKRRWMMQHPKARQWWMQHRQGQ